jgi:hypothetical protein
VVPARLRPSSNGANFQRENRDTIQSDLTYKQTRNLRAVATALAKNCARAGIILFSRGNAGATTAAYAARGGFAAVGDRAGPHATNFDFVGDGGIAVDADGI